MVRRRTKKAIRAKNEASRSALLNGDKKLTGNQMAIKVIDELLKLSPEELQKKIEENSNEEHHWITNALMDAGYFDRLIKERK